MKFVVQQYTIADLKFLCMSRLINFWDRVCINLHDTRYKMFFVCRVPKDGMHDSSGNNKGFSFPI